ncbi:hypothetical protein COLO4_11773 [Corchorus olitorius]|uniref:Pentatricopeptide repeat-containing protein n=1 Tax=Corchorus olitorius TaxID=93759 RepID=A0A1R3K3G3_9ROSI|nr:hypothetical protein COLO4_11773 [Corchorus olitorius]
MCKPSVPSFSALIFALNKANLFIQSLDVFTRMLSRGILPDSHMLPNIVKACGQLSAFIWEKEVHGFVCKFGFDSDSAVQASLVHFYLKSDGIGVARNVFVRLPEWDVVTCGALLSAYAREGCVSEAMEIFKAMQSFGLRPNLVTWNGMITGFNQSGQCNEAVVLFKKMHSEGFQPDDITISSVLSAVGDLEMLKVGNQVLCYVIKLGELLRVFEEIDEEVIDVC